MQAVWTSTFFIYWEKEIQCNMSDNKKFIDEAIAILDNKRSNYDKIKDEIIKSITDELDKAGIMYVSVLGRSKDSKRLGEKIYRKNYAKKYLYDATKFIDDLQDGIGIRIVCFMNDDEPKIIEILRKYLIGTQNESGRNYNFASCGTGKLYICFENQPEQQKNGLDIYRMDAFYKCNNECVKMEIQVKSLTNYFWGELEHKLFYKNYNYTISNEFLEGLMMNIHKELSNIDSEISMLQSHLAKDGNEERLELHQIAALMISKKYEMDIQSILDCKIDLREVYSLIVDLFFGLAVDETENRKQLSRLLDYLKDSSEVGNRFESINDEKLNSREIAEENKRFAEIIDRNIHSEDIFWIAFFAIYESLFKDNADTYSKIINQITNKIRSLFNDVVEVADALIDDVNEDIRSIIDIVMERIMNTTNKIANFSMEYRLPKIKKALQDSLVIIQNTVYNNNYDLDKEKFKNNIPVITNYLYVVSMSNIGEKISKDMWNKILGETAQDEYDFILPCKAIKFIEESGQLSPEELDVLKEKFSKEQ